MEWAIVMAAKIANQTVRMAKRVREADGLSAGEEMPILRCDRTEPPDCFRKKYRVWLWY